MVNYSLRVHRQLIDPSIQEFREKWYSSPEDTAELNRRKRSIPLQYSSLSDDEISPIPGLPGLGRVDISSYTPVWEDVDTLLLRQPWYRFWKDPVAVRLTGIDAPEISHPGDPTEWFRFQQEQPFGREALRSLEEYTTGKQLSVVVGTGENQKTYGRYLGVVSALGEDEPINITALRRGWAAALPFGEAGSDILPRQSLIDIEEGARESHTGMWAEPYWQKYHGVVSSLGGRITFNTLTDLTRLSKNYHLAAMESYLRQGEPDTYIEKHIGKKLIPSYGRFFSGVNTPGHQIEGMRHEGYKGPMRHQSTPFGSKYDVLRDVAESLGQTFEQLTKSKSWIEAVKSAKFVKHLGEPGSFGQAELLTTTFAGREINLVRKTIHDEAKDNLALLELAIQEGKETGITLEQAKNSLSLAHEASIYKSMGTTPSAPSLYFHGVGAKGREELYMEAMPGAPIWEYATEGEMTNIIPALAQKELKATLRKSERLGIYNPDIHSGNILYDPVSQRVSWIDWGAASRVKPFTGADWDIPLAKLYEVPGIFKHQKSIDAAFRGMSPIPQYASRFSAHNSNYNSIEGMPHGGIAGHNRSKDTDFGSGLTTEMFGSVKAFIQASKQSVRSAIKEKIDPLLAMRKAGDIAKSGPGAKTYLTELEGRVQLEHVIEWSEKGAKRYVKKQYPKATRKGIGDEILSEGIKYHEAAEVTYQKKRMASLRAEAVRQAKEETGGLISENLVAYKTASLLEKTPGFGSHASPGVIVDEILIAMKEGEAVFQAAKAKRFQELKAIEADLAKAVKGKIEVAVNAGTWMPLGLGVRKWSPATFKKFYDLDIQQAQNYIERTRKIYATMEKNYLPKFIQSKELEAAKAVAWDAARTGGSKHITRAGTPPPIPLSVSAAAHRKGKI